MAVEGGDLRVLVRRVDVDALHLAAVVRQQGLQGQEIVSLDQQIAGAGIADREAGVNFSRWRDFAMLIENGFFADPVESRRAGI